MHPNPSFRPNDKSKALAFARERGFGILSINGETSPLTAHFPFVIESDDRTLIAHLVASNPIYQLLREGPKKALISVSGPDGYISPDWYGVENQVPTWNYVAVNLRGTLCAEDQEILPVYLGKLSDEFESRLAPKPIWKMDKLSDDDLARMLRQIRPIRLEIDDIDSTFKLGQNKPDSARLGAADALPESQIGHEVAALASLMRNAG